jgi:hypothetical protein
LEKVQAVALIAIVFAAVIATAGIYALTYKPGTTNKPGTTSESSTLSYPLITTTVIDQSVGIQFTMTIQNTSFRFGEPVNITFTITNIGKHTFYYGYNAFLGGVIELYFTVSNSSNSVLYNWALTQLPFGNLMILAEPLLPGENLTVPGYVWPQTCNQTSANPAGVQVSPGQYNITGQYEFDSGPGGSLTTSALQVTVLAD